MAEQATGGQRFPEPEPARLGQVRTAFASALAAGKSPRIEDCLAGVSGAERESLLSDLLRTEVEYLRRLGHSPRPEDYASRFPGETLLIDRVFRVRPPAGGGVETQDWSRADDVATPPLPSERSTPRAKTFGRFLLLELVGRGAFGEVYRAHDPQLQRDVALKLPRFMPVEDEREKQRFLREARAAAPLRHPRIVTVHEVGSVDGIPYIASEFISGPTLRDFFERNRRLARRDVARTVAELARALDYAHLRGVIHRDVKPENVLIDANGQPYLTDFGLAGRLQGNMLRTQESVLQGTPAYMSPEQAEGRRAAIGGHSDQWSLGVMLYELLTGVRPFAGNNVQLLQAILHDDPVPPRRRDGSIPRDLETICLKCLARPAQARYENCGALADDLERWLRHEPIRARPIGFPGRAARWVRRHPVLASAVGVIGIALLTVAGIVAGARSQLAEMDTVVQQSRTEKERAEREARQQQEAATRAAASEAAAQEHAAQIRMEGLLDQALTLCKDGDLDEGLLRLATAVQASSDSGSTWNRLARLNLRAWRTHAHALERIVEATTPLPLVRDETGLPFETGDVPLVAGGVYVARDSDGGFHIRDAENQADVAPPIRVPGGWSHARLSPDGRRLLIHHAAQGPDGTSARVAELQLWDARTGKQVALLTPEASLSGAAFSPDGKWVAMGTPRRQWLPSQIDQAEQTEYEVRFWDAGTGRPLGFPRTCDGPVDTLAFSPNGELLALAINKWVLVHSVLDGELVGQAMEQPGETTYLQFGPDSRTLLVIGSKISWAPTVARLWNVDTGEPRFDEWVHKTMIRSAAISPDGSMAIIGAQDGTARVWSLATGKPIGQPLRHSMAGPVLVVGFSADDRLALTATCADSADAAAENQSFGGRYDCRVWRLAPRAPPPVQFDDASELDEAWFDQDGTILVGITDEVVRSWDLSDGKARGPGCRLEECGSCVAVSPDGKKAAFESRAVQYWTVCDLMSGKPLAQVNAKSAAIRNAAFSPGGDHLVLHVASPLQGNPPPATSTPPMPALPGAETWHNHALKYWDLSANTLTTVSEVDAHSWTFAPYELETEASGRPLLALARQTAGGMRIWVLTERERREFLVPTAVPELGLFVEIRADAAGNRLLVFNSASVTSQLWDVSPANRHLVRPLVHTAGVSAAVFSPDGAKCAIATLDGRVQLWNANTAKPVGHAMSHPEFVATLAFDSSGEVLLTDTSDRTLFVWDVATQRQIGKAIGATNEVFLAERLAAGSNRLLVALADGTVRSYDLHPLDDPPFQVLEDTAQFLGARLDPSGRLRPLTLEEWQRKQEQ